VPLCPEAAEIARRHLAQANGPWLFHASDTWGSRPGQFKNGRIWRALKNVLKKLGINHGTVHTFRHCFCSYLANQHISPYLVKEFMGHLKLDTVLAYYQAGANDLLTGMALVSFGQMLADAESKESSQVLANRDKAGPGRTNTTAEQKES
jgi:integrase